MKRFWILISILWLATCGGGGGSPTEPKEPAPVSNFTATPTTLIQGQAVTFTSTSTGTITSYAWNVDADPAIEGTTATYEHTYTEVGTYSITLTVTGPGGSNPKTVADMITVSTAAPTPTTATSQTVQEDGSTTISLTATDPNGQAVTFAITTDPSNGTATLSGTDITYTPNANFYGTDTVAYTASNGTYTSDPVTITITVEGEDDEPTTNDVSATTDEDTAVTLTLDATEIDGDNYSFSIVSQPTNGTLGSVNGNQVEYTPNQDFNGTDTFTFEATDDRTFRRNVATATITVNAVNDAPVANDVTASMNENKEFTRLMPVTITLDATDVEGDDLTYSIVGTPSNGTLGSITNNQVIYTPSQDWNGEDTFTYKANDGTDDSNTATVTVTVNAVNDAPVTTDQSASTNEDTAVEITLTATDVENDNLTFTIVSDVSNGTTSLSGATVTYTPDSNWNGTDTFTFKANDGTDDSNTSTITITVASVNDAPVANDVTASTQSRTGNMRQAVTITLDATDVEGDDLTYSLVSDVSNGTTSLSGNVVTYTPTANYDGTDTFTYKANDGTADSNTATGNITVENVNLIPTLVDTLFSKFISKTFSPSIVDSTIVALNLKEILNDDNPNDNTFSIVETLNLGNASIISDQLVYTPDLLDFFPHVATTPNNVHHVRGGIKSDLIKIVSYDGENNSNIATVEVELKKQADIFYRKNSSLLFESSVMDSDGLVLYSRTQSQIGRVLKIDDDSGDLIWEYDFSNTSEGSYTHFYYGKIKKHSDGSYIFTCNVHLNINTLTLYIGKVSSSGSSFEYKVYNNGEDIRARDFVETNDGNLVIGLLSGGIMKVNGSLNGDIIWKKELDYSSDNFVDSTSDGGVITIGHNSALQKQMLRKIDSSGEVEWTKLFDGNRSSGIKTTPEGGYIFDVDYTIYKADSAGDIEWNFSTSNYGDIVINVIQLTSDGGYIFGGRLYLNGISQTRTLPAWVKLSSAGSVEWDHQSFDNMRRGFYVNGIDESVDGGFLLSGDVYNYHGNAGVEVDHSAGWILKINSQGERVWPNLSD